MLRLLLLHGFGLAPLWVSALFIWLGSHETHRGSDYWNVAPWLLTFAWPYLGWSYGLAIATDAVCRRRGFKLAALAFTAMLLTSVLAVWLYLRWSQAQSREQEHEETRVLAFVREQLPVTNGTASGARVWLVTTTHERQSPIITYEVGIGEPAAKPRFAIVTVDQRRTPPHRLECITDKHAGLRDPHRPACAQ